MSTLMHVISLMISWNWQCLSPSQLIPNGSMPFFCSSHWKLLSLIWNWSVSFTKDLLKYQSLFLTRALSYSSRSSLPLAFTTFVILFICNIKFWGYSSFEGSVGKKLLNRWHLIFCRHFILFLFCLKQAWNSQHRVMKFWSSMNTFLIYLHVSHTQSTAGTLGEFT